MYDDPDEPAVRSVDRLLAEKIDFDYEMEIILTVDEACGEIDALINDLAEGPHEWNHSPDGKEPLWDAIVYHTRHLQMILRELHDKRSDYVEGWLDDWSARGLPED